MAQSDSTAAQATPDSRYAVVRLLTALALMAVGGSGMYVIAVVLPTVQLEFGVTRGGASVPYTALLVGFGVGGLLMGHIADRFGIMVALLIGAVSLGLGYSAAAMAPNIWVFTLVHGLLIGLLGCGATFAPLIADTSLWFVRRRGIAVAVCASGNYLSGVIWPPIVQNFVYDMGWRQTYIAMGIISFVAMASLALIMRPRPPAAALAAAPASGRPRRPSSPTMPFGLSPGKAQALLCIAGLACCVAMSMPQVHIVAYCLDLGYGAARGAEMLSLMLACGIASRIISGIICDRIGGLRTLLLGSALQAVALMLFLPFDGLVSLYIIAGMFGLFQGGIVPAYAIIVREHFSPAEAGSRVGMIIMFTMLGMALGGWLSGAIFDLTGSYRAAFLNGMGWNLVNLTIAITLLYRTYRRSQHPPFATS